MKTAYTEYRVVVNGHPCTDGTLSGGSAQGHFHRDYTEAAQHAEWHLKESRHATAEIESRTVTVTEWRKAES